MSLSRIIAIARRSTIRTSDRSLSRAMVIPLAALLVMACQPEPGERDWARPGAADLDAPRLPGERAEPRVAAEIARNLPHVPDPVIEPGDPTETIADLDNAAFRDRTIAFVREVAAG